MQCADSSFLTDPATTQQLANQNWIFSTESAMWEKWERGVLSHSSWLQGAELLTKINENATDYLDTEAQALADGKWRIWIKYSANVAPFYLQMDPDSTIRDIKRAALPWIRKMKCLEYITKKNYSRCGPKEWQDMSVAAGTMKPSVVHNKTVEEIYENLIQNDPHSSLCKSSSMCANKMFPQKISQVTFYYNNKRPLIDAATLKGCGLAHNETIGFQPVIRGTCCGGLLHPFRAITEFDFIK